MVRHKMADVQNSRAARVQAAHGHAGHAHPRRPEVPLARSCCRRGRARQDEGHFRAAFLCPCRGLGIPYERGRGTGEQPRGPHTLQADRASRCASPRPSRRTSRPAQPLSWAAKPFMRPWIFHQRCAIQNKQGGMKKTLLSVARPVASRRRRRRRPTRRRRQWRPSEAG